MPQHGRAEQICQCAASAADSVSTPAPAQSVFLDSFSTSRVPIEKKKKKLIDMSYVVEISHLPRKIKI
jgi:hypothetical protein